MTKVNHTLLVGHQWLSLILYGGIILQVRNINTSMLSVVALFSFLYGHLSCWTLAPPPTLFANPAVNTLPIIMICLKLKIKTQYKSQAQSAKFHRIFKGVGCAGMCRASLFDFFFFFLKSHHFINFFCFSVADWNRRVKGFCRKCACLDWLNMLLCVCFDWLNMLLS